MPTRVTKKDIVVAELQRRISIGELQRGDWIRQDLLAEELDTSITPVREALRELEAKGLLVGHPHRGVRVAKTNLEQVKGIYMCRRLIEPYAIQRAAYRMSHRDLQRARRLNEDLRRAHEEGDGLRASELNREFHFVFYDRSGPDSFVETIRSLWSSFPWDMLRVLSDRIESSIAEHEALLEALENLDMEAVRSISELHILHGYRALATKFELVASVSSNQASEFNDPFDI